MDEMAGPTNDQTARQEQKDDHNLYTLYY